MWDLPFAHDLPDSLLASRRKRGLTGDARRFRLKPIIDMPSPAAAQPLLDATRNKVGRALIHGSEVKYFLIGIGLPACENIGGPGVEHGA
jgi:hypothetical protein